jgi:SAM-dependent methyltransferase
MISRRNARILDDGCGIGAAVNGLRARGRAAFGVDPTLAVLEVAEDLFDPAWFRNMPATAISPGTLASNGLPKANDVMLILGNVPSFLTRDELDATFGRVAGLLEPGGVFVVATTTAIQGSCRPRQGGDSGRLGPDVSLLELAPQTFSRRFAVVRQCLSHTRFECRHRSSRWDVCPAGMITIDGNSSASPRRVPAQRYSDGTPSLCGGGLIHRVPSVG